MYKKPNRKVVKKTSASKRVAPMPQDKSNIDKYQEPILPEQTSYKFKESDIFEQDSKTNKKAKVKTKLKKK